MEDELEAMRARILVYGLGVALLLLVASQLVSTIVGYAEGKCKLVFLVLGDPGCPHCRRTNETLNKLFPGCVVFGNIEANATAARLYKGLWDTVVGWPGYAVPFTVVLMDGRPIAFVVGEEPSSWWKSLAMNLTRAPPSTALVCIGKCKSIPESKYRRVLNVYKTGGIAVKVAACSGLRREIVYSVFGTYTTAKLPRELIRSALKVFNRTSEQLRGYVLVCSRYPVLVLFEKKVPTLYIKSNRTINVDLEALSIALDLATSRTIKRIGGYLILVTLRNGRPVAGIKPLLKGSKLLSEIAKYCTAKPHLPLYALIPSLLGLAAIDSINPCFLALYTALIAATAATAGALAAASSGLSIALGVYAGYYLLGFGISQALEVVGRPLRIILALVMLFLAFRSVMDYWQTRSGAQRECRICRLVEARRLSLPLLVGLGFIASWTLLPCTAGPYLVAVTLMEGYPLYMRLLLLALYNIVFIAPLLIVLLGAAKVAEKYEKLAPLMELIAGVILLGFSIIILLEEAGVLPVVF